jgi:hypothetical protein
MNAFRPTQHNRDFCSNVTEESDLQSEKHSLPKTLIDAGRMISTKPVFRNAPDLIRDKSHHHNGDFGRLNTFRSAFLDHRGNNGL